MNSSGGVPRTATLWYSTLINGNDVDDQPSRDNDGANKEGLDEEFDDFLGGRPELQLQGVDPRRGWGFRGVHKVLTVVNFISFFITFVDIFRIQLSSCNCCNKTSSINFESV